LPQHRRKFGGEKGIKNARIPVVVSATADPQGFGAPFRHFHTQPLPFEHNTVCHTKPSMVDQNMPFIALKNGGGYDLFRGSRLQRLHIARRKQMRKLVAELGFSG
jgi:hypothetical protein